MCERFEPGWKMSEQGKVKKLLKEAVIYKKQGLFPQSKTKFSEALDIMTKSEALRTNETLITAIKEKLRDLDETIRDVDEGAEAPELSEEVQELIKKSFSFSKDKEAAAIEGAMALAKFGQYDKALDEFNQILEYATLPVMIAKNIIRCHLSKSPPQAAVDQFTVWAGGERFSREELKHLKEFLESLLDSRGIHLVIPDMPGGDDLTDEEALDEDEEIDIASISIRFDSGPRKGQALEFNVDLQSRNTVSIVIPANERGLVQVFKHGMRLAEIQCFSPIGLFPNSGTVSGKTKVLHGPNQGAFMVDIKLDE
jgi:tetratricopeptide (TPR) repeat protein